jgi:glycine hydroxymethyltransferase
VATGGTDNHLMLIDVRKYGLTGRQAESALRECGITLNRNSLPFDPNGPWYTSGLRIGTPAITTLGMGKREMEVIAAIIADVVKATKPEISATGDNAGKPSKAKYVLDESVKKQARTKVKKLLDKFPVYPQIDLEFLLKHFS